MTKEELIACLGTIAQSGNSKFLSVPKENKDVGADNALIGQFGVGFYSAFLVAEKVVVSTKSPKSDKQYIWEAAAESNKFVIKEETDPDPDPEKMLRRGTQITLYLRPVPLKVDFHPYLHHYIYLLYKILRDILQQNWRYPNQRWSKIYSTIIILVIISADRLQPAVMFYKPKHALGTTLLMKYIYRLPNSYYNCSGRIAEQTVKIECGLRYCLMRCLHCSKDFLLLEDYSEAACEWGQFSGKADIRRC